MATQRGQMSAQLRLMHQKEIELLQCRFAVSVKLRVGTQLGQGHACRTELDQRLEQVGVLGAESALTAGRAVGRNEPF